MCTSIQEKIYYGYGIAANKIGDLFTLYRPLNPLSPLTNIITTLYASFNAKDWTYAKANTYGQPQWYGVFNGNLTKVGDYLINSSQTFFIAGMQRDLPILCVECNRTVSVSIQDLSSSTVNSLTPIALNVPCSLLEGSQSKGKLDGPETVGQGRYRLLIPNLGIYLTTNYILKDDLDQSYEVLSTELTDFGWRCMLERIRT